MSTITDVLWDNLLRELRDIHRFVTTGTQLRKSLDAYIDARIAEKRTQPFKLASNEEMAEYLRSVQNAKPVPQQATLVTRCAADIKPEPFDDCDYRRGYFHGYYQCSLDNDDGVPRKKIDAFIDGPLCN